MYNLIWLVVSTHLKNISQRGSFPQIGMKIKNIWNHHPVMLDPYSWVGIIVLFVLADRVLSKEKILF